MAEEEEEEVAVAVAVAALTVLEETAETVTGDTVAAVAEEGVEEVPVMVDTGQEEDTIAHG